MKSSRSSLREIRGQAAVGWDTDRSWCPCHTTSMTKFSWLQLMTPWITGSIKGQDEKI